MAVKSGSQVLRMNNGVDIPVLGLGTWLSTAGDGKRACKAAVTCGYRHIDTAQLYGNESDVGDAIQELIQDNVTTRDELFITTKLSPAFMGADTVKPACEESLRKLKVDFIDLFLIHSPMGLKYLGLDKPFSTDDAGRVLREKHDLLDCWKAMENLVDAGLVRSIGVSNFNSEQVDRILKHARIKPVINQIECHAYFAQNELSAFLGERDILVMAYAPLGAPGRPDIIRQPSHASSVLQHHVICELAKKHKKTAAQICLRSLVQRGVIVIPKSTNPERIKENSQIFDFELSDIDMAAIASINLGQRLFDGRPFGDPTVPEFPFSASF